MKQKQFTLTELNPDCMSTDEIMEWINFIGQGLKPQVAKQWFPEMKGQFKHTRNVRNYLWNKLTAIHCREMGMIQQAIKYETICDSIYASLPESAKW